MEHHREPEAVEAGMEVTANGFGRCKMNRNRGFSVVAPCSHVTETRVILSAEEMKNDNMNQGGTT